VTKLNRALLEVLACPCEHHSPVNYDSAKNTLTCQRCETKFEVRDGIPIMLLGDATPGPNGIGIKTD
jgi:uncharacterized protein YbaR (Trm112 family)